MGGSPGGGGGTGGSLSGGGAGGGAGGSGGAYGWVVQDPGSGYSIMSMWGDLPDSMWAVDIGGRLLAYGGVSWQFVWGGALPALNSVFGLAGQSTLFFVGATSQYYQVQGLNVSDLSQGDGVENLAVWAASADQVWIGSNGFGRPIAAYGGSSWKSYGPADLGSVQAIWGPAANDAWAVDNAGMILHWNGTDWTKASSSATSSLTSIHGSGSTDVWTVGPRTMLHWDGTRWSEIADGRDAGLIAVWAAGANDVWAVGGNGRILHGGVSGFQSVPSGTSLFLYTIWGSSPTDIWTGGEDGVLIHYQPTNGAPPPDAGPGCKQQGEACGIGDCCYPFNCTRLAANILACV